MLLSVLHCGSLKSRPGNSQLLDTRRDARSVFLLLKYGLQYAFAHLSHKPSIASHVFPPFCGMTLGGIAALA